MLLLLFSRVSAVKGFTLLVIMVVFSTLLHERTNLLFQVDASKFTSLALVFFAILLVTARMRFSTSIAMYPLILLALFPLPIHGYINAGLLLQVLIVLAILSSGVDERIVSHAIVFYLILLLFMVALGLVVTGDPVFLRDSNIPFGIYELTPLSNPNVFSRYIIILLPLLLAAKQSSFVNSYLYWVVVFGLVLSVVVVASSRANSMALLCMGVYWVFRNRRITLPQISFGVLLLSLLAAWFFVSPMLQHKMNGLSHVVSRTYELIETAEDGVLVYDYAPSRAKTWAASYVVVKDNLFFGVGKEAAKKVEDAGAVKVDFRTGKVGHRIAVHGGWLNVVTATGVVGLFLLVGALAMLYFELDSIGRMFLIGTTVSQIGADVYAHTLFWVVLGILIFRARSIGTSRYSNSSTVMQVAPRADLQ